ncbi:MAG: hypothetical protein ABIT70_04385 [Sulfuriferula sp.]
MKKTIQYCGFNQDSHGMTMLARIVVDAWLFELLPRDQDCAGWDMSRMQKLTQEVEDKWDAYGNIPSRLPEELRQRHAELYDWVAKRARERGWNPELEDTE